jgi:DnaJ-domain-containing protein 1
MNISDSSDNSKIRVLATATLMRRFHEQCPTTEIYEKATRSYETLIDTIEKKHTAKEIATLLDIPEITIKRYAEAIIDILLFNKENDPYLSFGLTGGASFSKVNRRWKSLIVLYHPDRYLNKQLFENRAKKINGIYEELQMIQKQKIYSSPYNMIKELSLPRTSKIFHVTYLKYLPYIIIVLAIIIAIFSLLLFFFNFSVTTTYTSSQETKRKDLKIIQTEYNKVSDINSY